MALYKHYSFDLWLTLIRSNPLFKTERNRLFHRDYNHTGKSLEEVAIIFRQVDLMSNAINERTGKNIDADELYLMVISMINDGAIDLQTIDTDKLYSDMEDLVYSHMPLVYSGRTIDVLSRLKEDGSPTMNILSNTGFIKGHTLRKVLQHLELDLFFDFQIYSDEQGLSKPNPALFNFLLARLNGADEQKSLILSDIMHVGDNPLSDIAGAVGVGIHSMLINSNSVCISNLLQ